MIQSYAEKRNITCETVGFIRKDRKAKLMLPIPIMLRENFPFATPVHLSIIVSPFPAKNAYIPKKNSEYVRGVEGDGEGVGGGLQC